ncbi:hypothetical protein JCM15519_07000 [Fundidesulfovibrio butyratiphilus]
MSTDTFATLQDAITWLGNSGLLDMNHENLPYDELECARYLRAHAEYTEQEREEIEDRDESVTDFTAMRAYAQYIVSIGGNLADYDELQNCA